MAGWINRGRARARLGEWAAAEGDLTAAVKLTPLDKDLYNELSLCCQRLHKQKASLAHYATYLDLADGIIPGDPDSQAHH